MSPATAPHSLARTGGAIEDLVDDGFESRGECRRIGIDVGALSLQAPQVGRDGIRARRLAKHSRDHERLAEQSVPDRRWRDYAELRQIADSLEQRSVSTDERLEI